MNYGLRYEYTPPFLYLTGNLVNMQVPFVDMTPNITDMSRHPTFVRQGSGDFYEGFPVRFESTVKVARDGRLGERLVAADKKNFAPRLGIAWNPSSKWVIRRLESLRAFNEAYPTADPTLSVASRSPYPELSRIQEVDGSGKANYNALSVKLQRRFSKGLTYLFGYTWSRSIDYGSAIRVHSSDLLFPQNSYDLRAERGLSSFHTPHRGVTSVLYELPFGKGRRFMSQSRVAGAALGGWEVGS